MGHLLKKGKTSGESILEDLGQTSGDVAFIDSRGDPQTNVKTSFLNACWSKAQKGSFQGATLLGGDRIAGPDLVAYSFEAMKRPLGSVSDRATR